MIQYYSTRGNSPRVNFQEALFRGLAPDGGLYYPDQFPIFSEEELQELIGADLPAVGYAVLSKWFGEEIAADALKEIAISAQHFPIPLRKVGPYYVLEVTHGPTAAFKDVAAQNLSRLMSYFLQARDEEITLLVATSGDTGGAIAHGFSNVPNIQVKILFPKGRVSPLQEEQLTRVADNIEPLEVEGVFDDCQAMVKQAFNDPDLAHLKLTSANSISIGRLIPQIIYYVYAYAQLGRDDIQFVVPSGNFGNLTGGLFAAEMGLPFSSFLAATNQNDASVRYMQTGRYEPRQTVQTLSNAMDVGNPSNFVRVLELFNQDYKAFRDVIAGMAVDDKTTVETLKRVYETHDYLLDPHTAVGWQVAEEMVGGPAARPVVIVATASPIKFAGSIRQQADIEVDDQAAIKALQARPARKTPIENDYEAFKRYLVQN
ncbi:MAG: threonine synthase [Chloroflexota bacterium]